MRIFCSKIISLPLALTTTLFSVQGHAEELFDGQGFDFAGGKLSPELSVKLSHSDNLTFAADNEIKTFITLTEPSLTYDLQGNKNRITLRTLLSIGEHDSSHQDDYVDKTIQASYEYTPTRKTSAGIDFEYFKGHDPRGIGAAEGTGLVQQRYDRYDQYKVDVNAAYGARSAKGRFEIDGGYKDKEYQNNFAVTTVRDREDTYGSARLFYRVMPKTRAVLEGRVLNVNYVTDAAGTPTLDSVAYKGLVGLVWDSTYKTTGSAKLGYVSKDFDAGARKDGDDAIWEVEVEWRPRTYSIFNIHTSRDYAETNGTGDFTREDKIAGSYEHEWTSKVKTRLQASYQEDRFSEDTAGREDDLTTFSAYVDFEPRRWATLGTGYSYGERDSTTSSFDYERNLFEVYAKVVF